MRPRAWRIMMWMSLAATVVLVGAGIWSRHRYVRWADGRGVRIGVDGGSFFCGDTGKWDSPGWMKAYTAATGWGPFFDFAPGGRWYLRVPLWMPTGVSVAVCVHAAFKVPATRRPGHCPRCGYDLSGLPTAVCPECGKGVK